ncbi:MAG TPA: hypothetical protein VN457_02825 [Chlamydiales bacterium]|nr:hypothetical protein [Chlamydiales bacterium]
MNSNALVVYREPTREFTAADAHRRATERDAMPFRTASQKQQDVLAFMHDKLLWQVAENHRYTNEDLERICQQGLAMYKPSIEWPLIQIMKMPPPLMLMPPLSEIIPLIIEPVLPLQIERIFAPSFFDSLIFKIAMAIIGVAASYGAQKLPLAALYCNIITAAAITWTVYWVARIIFHLFPSTETFCRSLAEKAYNGISAIFDRVVRCITGPDDISAASAS